LYSKRAVGTPRNPLLDRLRQSNLELADLSTRHASLEDVFVTLTGRHLREASTPS